MSPDLKQAGVLFFNPTFSFPRASSSREAGMDHFPFVILVRLFVAGEEYL
jgi:hypothetical protein